MVPEVVHHQIEVRVDPDAHALRVEDTLRLPPSADRRWRFALHAGLEPVVDTRGWRLERVDAPADGPGAGVPLDWFELRAKRRTAGDPHLTWSGALDHPPTQVATEYQRSFAESPGTIGPDGVVLSGASYWVPTFGAAGEPALVTFDLAVDGLPAGWDAVSQGARAVEPGRVTYRAADPTEEVHLVAAPFVVSSDRYTRPDGTAVDVRTFLRAAEPALSNRYLVATRRYLAMYESLLPRYPFPSFALAENHWETGYGMPGFTLLGSQVIRFPWILTSSYPHELLHNWWGNGAFVEGGNWCEGLTAYLADHLFAEQRGEGASYRRATLQRFTDLVDADTDFPLTSFRGRDSAASEAVGYGKSLMLFHQVRRAIGDEAFVAGLRAYFDAHEFTRAGFDEWAEAFSTASGTDLRPLFDAWTTRVGAPVVSLGEVGVAEADGGFTLTVSLTQSGGPAFPLAVPIAVTVEGEPEARRFTVALTEAQVTARFPLDRRPVRLDVDPQYDVMRRLDPLEVAPALSTLFGADAPVFVLPSGAPAAERDAWTALATAFAAPSPPTLVEDTAGALPSGSVWVLGYDNLLAPAVAATVPGASAARAPGRSTVLVGRAPADPAAAVGFVGADLVEAIPGLARKLPHYGRYGRLAFEGPEPTNTEKVALEPVGSPLVRNLTAGPLPPVRLPADTPLAQLPSRFDRGAVLATATALADPSLEGRGLGTPGLDAATDQVREALRAAGLNPEGEPFAWTGGEPAREWTLRNVVVRLPGTDPAAAPVVVTAHLDHLGTGWPDVREGNAGKVHPGADDNASGVAVALELARVLGSEPARLRPVVIAFTTGEEAGLVGARHLFGGELGATPFACVNLDTVGRKGASPVTVIGADSAREWRFAFQGIGYTTGIQTTFAVGALASSDHAACQAAGAPAVQLFTGANADYHRPTDTADHLDADGMVDVADLAYEAVGWLADRAEPLTVQLGGAPAPSPGSGRKVGLGTMPDFGFAGPGVRVQDVMPDSAASRAGVRIGDVIVAVGGAAIADLRAFSDALAARAPGDRVAIELLRDGQRLTVQATLTSR